MFPATERVTTLDGIPSNGSRMVTPHGVYLSHVGEQPKHGGENPIGVFPLFAGGRNEDPKHAVLIGHEGSSLKLAFRDPMLVFDGGIQ